MSGVPLGPEGSVHSQRNSLQFQTNDPPRLALANAAQQARKHRQRRSLQGGGISGQTSAEASFTPSTLQAQAMHVAPRGAGGPHLTSPTSYALFGRLSSPRVSNAAMATPPPPSLQPHDTTAMPTTTASSASASPYENVTSAQTLLSVLKQRQAQRAAQAAQPAHVYTTHTTLGGQPVPLASPPCATDPAVPIASTRSAIPASLSASGRTLDGLSSQSSSSVYPQMRPRCAGGPAAAAAPPTSAIPFSADVPALSAQLAARGTVSRDLSLPTAAVAMLGTTMDNHPAENAEAEEGEEDEAAAAALAGAVGLEPVLAAKMPTARCIMLNMLTTWGDDHEVGLCGVELFNSRGDRIRLEPPVAAVDSTSADAQEPLLVSDVDVDGATICKRFTTSGGHCLLLAQYAGTPDEIMGSKSVDEIATDPRGQLSSLVNGQNNTHDEANMFVMPYTPGEHHLVCFVFTKPITVSMIRLINYCGRGRVHTSKGARIVEITADDVCVFRGEIAQHSGDLLTSSAATSAATTMDELDAETAALVDQWGVVDCENILFTEEPPVLEKIMRQTRASAVAALVEGRSQDGGKAGDSGGTREARRAAALTSGPARGPSATTTSPTIGAAPPRRLLLSTAREGPRGDRSQYVGGEAPMVVSARLLPTDLQPELVAAAAHSATAYAQRTKGQTSTTAGTAPAPRALRAASSDGGRRRAGTGQAWSSSPTHPPSSSTTTTAVGAETESGAPSRRQRAIKPRRPAQFPRQCPKEVRSVCLELLSTWGDSQSVGLSGLRFRDAAGDVIKVVLEHWAVQYPDGRRLPAAQANAQLPGLFDENHETACLLPFQPAMQVVLVFAAAVPHVGFLEVANYSLGEHTFCGVKDVRVFLCSAPVVPPSLPARVAPLPEIPGGAASGGAHARTDAAEAGADVWCPHTEVFARLWTVAASPASVSFLQAHRVQEVTPVAGVSLRKAPANLTQSRFQTYDLSLVGSDGLDAFDALAGSQLSHTNSGSMLSPSSSFSGCAPIGVGPGTGGDRLDMNGTLATGGLRAGFSTTMASFATSLNASMNIRAAMSMKRARMMLKDRPDWLLEYQPYITPLLPVGYVCRVRLHLCARSVGEAVVSAGTMTSADDAGQAPVYSTAAENMKAYLTSWVVKPLRSCSFVNENGDVIRPIKPGEGSRAASSRGGQGRATSAHFRAGARPAHSTARAGNLVRNERDMGDVANDGDMEGEEEEDTRSLAMVAECLVSTPAPSQLLQPQSAQTAATGPMPGAAPPLQVQLELLYVSDSPYCLSMVTLNCPLVLDGCAAWVKRAQIYMDDAMLYDSGEAVLKLRKADQIEDDARTAGGKAGDESDRGGGVGRQARGRTADGVLLPQCTTSLRAYVLFTLDESILEDIRQEDASTMAH